MNRTTGLLLIPMAGLAIGLADTTLSLFQLQGAVVSSVVLAAVAVLETIGPPISAKALRWSGDSLKPDPVYEESVLEPTQQA